MFLWDDDINIPKEFYLNNSDWFVKESEGISEYTNSLKGSYHWLSTIGGRICHIGEYMLNHSNEKLEHQKDWGETLNNEMREILDYFKDKLK